MKAQLRKAALVIFVGGALCVAWTVWTLTTRYERLMYAPAEIEQVPQKPVAVVFGAGYWPSGALSMVLKDRLDAAIELYHAGRVQKLLFSGDNRVVDYNEPAKMLEYALTQDVPRDDVVLDYAGRRTYDTCYRARDIFQVQDAVLITQRYHLPRALDTCDALGIDTVGYVADRQPYPRRDLAWYWTREAVALWRGWWDIYIAHTTPVLGEPLPIFTE
ncbi:MAG: YdcF family protein [Anaerolineae bacterium]|nr:YdcF family protein [Anaerolineae bacterium]